VPLPAAQLDDRSQVPPMPPMVRWALRNLLHSLAESLEVGSRIHSRHAHFAGPEAIRCASAFGALRRKNLGGWRVVSPVPILFKGLHRTACLVNVRSFSLATEGSPVPGVLGIVLGLIGATASSSALLEVIEGDRSQRAEFRLFGKSGRFRLLIAKLASLGCPRIFSTSRGRCPHPRLSRKARRARSGLATWLSPI
jgi:hypothetical protein